jgi:2',3'-cyclic-nucleotide 2'-phosphodiesterase (5'-nucleotidase family)
MSVRFKTAFFYSILFFIGLLAACTSGYKIVDGKYQNFSIDQKADSIVDKTYVNLLKPYSSLLDSELTGVIAFADTSLVADRPESPLSNFISDMLLEFGQQYANEKLTNVHVNFSLANNGGLRTSIPAGEIIVRNIYELLPFENELVLLSLSGEQVAILADHIVSRGGEGVGGITFGMKGQKAVNIVIQGKALDPNATYWMITNDYVANGGDGMKILKEASGRIETGEKIRDVVIDGLKQMKTNGQHVSAKTDGRIYHVE